MTHPSVLHVHPKGTPSRGEWSSIPAAVVAPLIAIALALGVIPVTSVGAQGTPTRAQLDSIRQRLDDAEAALQALREQLATEASTALRTRSRISLEFSGRAIMNVFTNDARTNNVDVPIFARPDSGSGPQGGLAMSIRQTRLGLAFSATEIAGGTFHGDIDADFFGGQQPSSGGRTFPLVRLRTARGTLEWTHGSVMIGQEQPLITGVEPVSLASVGVPGFTGAGNLWLWLPQVRGGVHTAGRVRVGAEAAVLAPTSGDPSGLFDTQFDAAERTRVPYLQGQLRLDWGEAERPGSITAGVHSGRIADAFDVQRTSSAVAATIHIPLGSRLEVRGEAFDGQALRGLGGGGIAQGLGVGGTPVRSRGGWAQVNLQASPRLLIGGGSGIDDPEDADVLANGRLRNTTTEAHVHWRPAGPVVIGFEWRRTATDYAAGSRTNQHLNLAFGFEF